MATTHLQKSRTFHSRAQKRVLRELWAVGTSTEHQEASSPDQHSTRSEADDTCCEYDQPRPEGPVEEVDQVITNANKAGEAEETFKASMKPKMMIELRAMSRLSGLSIRTKLPLYVRNIAKLTLKPTKVLKAVLKLMGMRYLTLPLKYMAVQ